MIEFLIIIWLIGRWLRSSGQAAHERIGGTMQEDVEGCVMLFGGGCLCLLAFCVLVALLEALLGYLGCDGR